MYLDFNEEDLRALSAATALALYDEAPGLTLAPVGFHAEATGRIQLMRTGSGFWRSDHGAPFSIDKKLLLTIVRNTRIRARPLRGDYFHWSNQDRDNPEDYRPAGYVAPVQLCVEPWKSPEGDREWGIFAPAVWTPEAKGLVDRGVNQISPVIDWNHRLRWDCRFENVDYPAGTVIGPTITKWSLVDEGFFWMDPARYYSNQGSSEGFLYKEVFMLSIDELLALIDSLRKAGTPDEKIIALITATLNGASSTPPTPDAGADATGAPGMSSTTPEGQGAAPATMAARLYQLLGAARQPQAPARTATPSAQPTTTRSTTPPANGGNALFSALMGALQPRAGQPSATAQPPRAPTAQPPATPPANPAAFSLESITGAVTSAIQTAIAPITQRIDGLEIAQSVSLFSQAEAAGLHNGLDQETAIRMFVESPGAYQSFISKRQPLVGSAPQVAANGASPLTRVFNNASQPVDERQALADLALSYQNDPKNVRNGKKPTYDTSLAYAIGIQTNQRRARGES